MRLTDEIMLLKFIFHARSLKGRSRRTSGEDPGGKSSPFTRVTHDINASNYPG